MITRRAQRIAGIALMLILSVMLPLSACNLTVLPPTPPTVQPGLTATPAGALLTPPASETGICMAASLKGAAGWQEASGTLRGAVLVTNEGTAPCVLYGRPGIHVVAGDKTTLPAADVEPLDTPSSCCLPVQGAPVLLNPGDKAYARFEWRNWCGTQKGPWVLAVALPQEGGQLNLHVLAPSGQPALDTPACTDANAASTVSIGSFVGN
jgi:hypothetical protein